MIKNENTGFKIFYVMNYIILASFILFTTIPFLFIISASITKESEIISDGYKLIPKELSLEAFSIILGKGSSIFQAYFISISVTVIGTFASLLVTAMVAYAVANHDLRHRNKIALFMFFTILFSGGIVPWYIMCTRYLGLRNNLLALILPMLLNPWYVFLMRNYFRSIPESITESARIDGAQIFTILFKIIWLKYNLPEIKTLADYETYMEGIKKNEPNMIPLVPRGTDAVYILDREYGRATRLFGDHYGPVYVDPTDKELKAKSYFESETFKQIVKKMEEWQKKGYLSKDIMTMKDKHAQFTSGKAASAEGHVFDVTQREEEARALIPEVKMKIYLLNPDKPKYVATNAFDLLSIGAKSQNVDRAVMFLNWVYSKQENYDLFSYGIENKNFTIKDKRIEYSTDNRYSPINWAWYNVNLVRFGVNDRQESIDTLLNWDKGAVVSEIAGFNFSQENIKAEIAQINTVDKEIAAPMLAGILSYDEYYPQLIDKLKKAGLEKLLDDAQKQLDAFKAGKQ